MPFNSHEQSYVDKLADLKVAASWLASIGIRLSSTRIASYERDIDLLKKAIAANDISSFVESDAGLRIANSFFEASQLIDLHKGLSGIPVTRGLLTRLKKLARGPVASSLEKPDGVSHQPRDFGFELFMASLFTQADFEIDLDQNTDLIANQSEKFFLVECKRPRHVRSLSPSIKAAVTQLKARLDKIPVQQNQFGLVAISLDLVIHGKQDLLIVPDRRAIEVSLKGSVRSVVDSNDSTALEFNHPRILGALFVVQLSALLLDSLRLTRCGYLLGFNTVGIDTPQGSIFRNVVDQLGPAIFKMQNAR